MKKLVDNPRSDVFTVTAKGIYTLRICQGMNGVGALAGIVYLEKGDPPIIGDVHGL